MQSVLITTKVASSNPAHGEVHSIQNYVIKFVSDLWQVSGFLRELDVQCGRLVGFSKSWMYSVAG